MLSTDLVVIIVTSVVIINWLTLVPELAVTFTEPIQTYGSI